jgi:hypothetical protein
MNLIRRCSATLSLVGALFATAHAVPQQYATGFQNIRAGVVILDSATATVGGSAAPYALYNLDSATSVKPAGWNIINPHAQGIVTNGIVAKWGSGAVYGAPITKQNAEYWSVYLDSASDTQLSDYDVLLLNPSGVMSLDSNERQKLMKFVDQGGILWIDTAGVTNLDLYNGTPESFGLVSGSPSSSVGSNAFEPLLNIPFQLSSADLNAVSGTGILSNFSGIIAAATNSADFPDSSSFSRYLGITFFGSTPMIADNREGDGAIVVTTMGPSQILGGSSSNNTFTANSPALGAAGLSAAKLAVNIISLAGDYSQFGGGARKTGYNGIDVTAPVLSRWSDETSGQLSAPPVLYKGVSVTTTNSSNGYQIKVYDSTPSVDLDGDGDPDDGIYNSAGALMNSLRDYSIGAPYDLIWSSSPLTGPVSSPVCAQVPDGYKGYTDVVMVVDGKGALNIYPLFPRDSSGHLAGAPGNGTTFTPLATIQTPAVGYTNNGSAPNAPTVSGDLAFMASAAEATSSGPSGAMWVVDLSQDAILTTSAPWELGNVPADSLNLEGLEAYTSSPTVGEIVAQDGSVGYDRVIYAPGIAGSNSGPGFDSLWLGAKGDSPNSYTVSGNTLTIETRASGSIGGTPLWITNQTGSPALNALNPRVTFLGQNGLALSTSAYINSSPTEAVPGELIYTVSNPGDFTGAVPVVAGIRVDYSIDWGKNVSEGGGKSNVVRGEVKFPVRTEAASAIDPQRVLGPIALTAAGSVVMAVGDPLLSDPDGSLWWFKEDLGRGQFRTTGRYSLYSAYTLPATPASIHESAVFEDVDPIQALVPTLSGAMTNWHWVGAPVVAGDQVIATATASKGFIPVTIAMAFESDPQTPRFPAANFPATFSLSQPDFDRSSTGSLTATTGPDVSSDLGSAAAGAVNTDTATGLVTLASLTPIVGSAGLTITDCLNMSEPLIISSGQTSTEYQPELNGGQWSPLNWYCVYNGTFGQGRPLVTGNTLFQAGNSAVPYLLTNPNPTFPPQTNAVIGAMDVQISQGDPFEQFATDRSWQPQVVSILTTPTFRTDPHIKMPSTFGLSSFNDYKTRLIQQTLGVSTQGYGVVGGGNSLVAWGNSGVYGLSRADFSICDQGRFIRVDSAGNPLFVSNLSLNSGPGGGSPVGNVHSLVRPTRAYPLSNSQTLVVDSGANRVIKMDSSGAELRAVDHFIVDPNFKPSGYTANEPRTFSAPNDAITYSNYVYSSASSVFQGQASEEYWVHYLVADTGHHRLVELIDRYVVNNGQIGPLVTESEADPSVTPSSVGAAVPFTDVPQAGVLLWQSPANVSGSNFSYNSVARQYLFQANGGGRYVYVAGIGNAQPTSAVSGQDTANNLSLGQSSAGNGGVVVFDPASVKGVQVYNSFDSPDLTGTPFWSGTPTSGTFQDNSNLKAQVGVPFSGLTSVSARSVLNGNTGDGALSIMVAQASGVYEFTVDPTQTNTTGDIGGPGWFINGAAYTQMRGGGSATNPLQFNPAYAKRLDSGEVLLVNSYAGLNAGNGTFTGEVVMLNGIIDSSGASNGEFEIGKTNLGFTTQSIHFNLPQGATGVRPILAPIFADRR